MPKRSKKTQDPEGFFIVSQLEIEQVNPNFKFEDIPGKTASEISVLRAEGKKCPRCWMWKPGVGADPDYSDVCPRCAGVLRESKISITD